MSAPRDSVGEGTDGSDDTARSDGFDLLAFSTERAGLVERLERALDRGRQLLAVSQGLQTALTPADVADIVTAQAREALGTYFAGIALADDETSTLRYLSTNPLPEDTAREWATIPMHRSSPVADAARLSTAFFHESVDQAAADFPDIGPHMHASGSLAMAHLPLVGSTGRVLGVLALTYAAPHPMSAHERDFMTTLANHTSQALERALLFDQQRSVADALQRAVLPPQLPHLPGWDLDARYVPATSGLEVGGDWYDAFWLPDGRLALAVGDATGHGLAAARVMSAVRNALRAYAVLGEGPAKVVERLDRLLVQLEPEAMATLVYVELDTVTGVARLAAAGHPPPLWCRDGEVGFLDLDVDPPLGCGVMGRDIARRGPDEAPTGVREERFEIAAGDVVLLYTDGLVERRDADILAGLERLRTAAGSVRPGEHAARRLLDVALDQLAEAGGSSDDVCALALHRGLTVDERPVPATPSSPARSLRAVLRPRPQSVAEARDQARAALVAWGLDALVDRVTLIVSELVTNAVTHAGTPTALELDLHEPDGQHPVLRIAVADQSVNEPELRAPDSSEEHGRGVALVDTLADRWGTTQRSSGKQVWAEIDVV